MIMHSNLSKMKNKIPQSVKKETTEKVWENSAIRYMVSRGGGYSLYLDDRCIF